MTELTAGLEASQDVAAMPTMHETEIPFLGMLFGSPPEGSATATLHNFTFRAIDIAGMTAVAQVGANAGALADISNFQGSGMSFGGSGAGALPAMTMDTPSPAPSVGPVVSSAPGFGGPLA